MQADDLNGKTAGKDERKRMSGRTAQLEKRITVFIAALTFILFFVLILISHRQKLSTASSVQEYNTGWTCVYEGNEKAVTLPETLDVPADTTIVLRNTLPEDVDNGTGIVFRSRMQRVRVYIDGTLIYRYPAQKMIGDAVPSTWNFIKLSERDAGKTVEICLESPYGSFSGLLPEVREGSYNELISETVREQAPIAFLSFFIGMVGAAVLLIAVVFRKYRLYTYQGSLGLLLMFLSMWLCGESRPVFQFIGAESQHYITLFALFLCPFFLISYLRARWENICGWLTEKLFYLCGACVPVAAVLEMTGVCSIVELIPLFHVLAAVSLGCMAYIYIQAARQEKKGFIQSELVCIVLIVIAGAAELLNFYLTGGLVGVYIRAAILIYALNLFRICAGMLFWKIKENRELDRQLRYSRAELMSSQIKPHFIYNTLNSIRTLIKTDPDTAYQTVYDFSTYLRANLDSVSGRETIPFSEEMKHIRAYLNIEKIRFEDRLHTELDIETESFPVPPLSIQPLVENAVKHGICKKVGGGTVWIRSREEEDAYIVEVEDDGVGFEWSGQDADREEEREYFSESAREGDKAEERSHIGIRSIRFRIGILSGGKLNIQSSPGKGTKVTVCFPKRITKFTGGDEIYESDDRGR